MLFITNAVTAVKECEHADEYPMEIYFGLAFPHIFALVDFSYWKAVLVEVHRSLPCFHLIKTKLLLGVQYSNYICLEFYRFIYNSD